MSKPGLIEVYLAFEGNCLKALNLYADLLHGEITSIMKYDEMPPPESGGMPDLPPIPDDAVLHSSIKIGDITLMASDNVFGGTVFGDNYALTWSHPNKDEVLRVWQGFLDAGATVDMELEPSFFADLFGSLTDPFGVKWQIMRWSPDDTMSSDNFG